MFLHLTKCNPFLIVSMLQNSFGIFSVNNIIVDCISTTFIIVIKNFTSIFLNADVFLLIESLELTTKNYKSSVYFLI